MGRYYYDHTERECYDSGRRDESRHRHNYDHDRYSSCPCDKAYFEGRRDEARAEERREEERREEEAAEQYAHARAMEQRAQEQYECEMQNQPHPPSSDGEIKGETK